MEASNRQKNHRGFTLVELLTVIVIIGILAGLISAAAVPAMRTARRSTIQIEIGQLSDALENYKIAHGDYPPDFAGVDGGVTNNSALQTEMQAAVLRHLRKAFPKYRTGASIPSNAQPSLLKQKGTYNGLLIDINSATRSNPADSSTGMLGTKVNLNPSTALVFMLGGPPARAGESTKLLGFSANPANPFAKGGSRLPPIYEFDETRLVITYDNSGTPTSLAAYIPSHMPQAVDGTKAPFVYFRPRSSKYEMSTTELPHFWQSNEQGVCLPYAETVTGTAGAIDVTRWAEPKKYQIICAGLDGLYGEPANKPQDLADVSLAAKTRYLKTEGGNILPEEDDNQTSFTQGKLEDRPEE